MVGLRHGLRLLKPAHKPAQRIPVLGRAASLLLGSADFGDVDVRRHQHLLRLDAEKQRVLADCLLPELRAGAEQGATIEGRFGPSIRPKNRVSS